MVQPSLPDQVLLDTITLYRQALGNKTTAARLGKMSASTFRHRFELATQKFPQEALKDIDTCLHSYAPLVTPDEPIKSVLIGGDAHFWPGEASIMWRAFVKMAKTLKPDCIILNGDILDGASVSIHKRMLGVRVPKVVEEVETAQERLAELPKKAIKLWSMGNHDIRIDNFLANSANELEEYVGSFVDRFPAWRFAHAFNINEVEVRHRFRGGIHTAWNNALHSGVSIVSSHTHQLQVTAVRSRKTLYGIECGMLADPMHRCFEYTEFMPSRICPGFVFLTFDDGFELMPPQVCELVRGRPAFQGSYIF